MAFAQDAEAGAWRLGGSGSIGTRLNFLPLFGDPLEDGRTARHASSIGRRWDDGDGEVRGNLDVMYKKGGFDTGLGINQNGGLTGKLTYNGADFTFVAETNEFFTTNPKRSTLWGNYKFDVLNGITLEAAVSRNDATYWAAGNIFGDTFTHNGWGGYSGDASGIGGFTFGSTSYLALDVGVAEGVNVGFKVPNFFKINSHDFVDTVLLGTVFGAKVAAGDLNASLQFALRGMVDNTVNTGLMVYASYKISDQLSADFDFRGMFGKVKGAGLEEYDGNDWNTVNGAGPFNKLDKDTLMDFFYGDYTKGSFENLADLRFAVGVTFNASPINVRLRFRYFNEVNTYGDTSRVDPKTGVLYGSSYYLPFGGGTQDDPVSGDQRTGGVFGIEGGKMRIEPRVRYTANDSLLLELGAMFEIPFGNYTVFNVRYDKDLFGEDSPQPKLRYEFTPALYFNFLGTGAGDDPATGMRFRWRANGYAEAARHVDNFLDIHFKWSF